MNFGIMNSFLRTIFSVCIFVVSFTSVLTAQEVGDTVVVTANFETKIYEKKVGQVYGGEVHTVDAIEGNWCQLANVCLLYTSPSPRDLSTSRMPSSA